jgi:hypothetical protein
MNTYSLQYERAFNILYESKASTDAITLPMMFLLRHHIELSLKVNINYFSKYSQSKYMLSNLNKEHKLKPLAEAFLQHWNIVVIKYKLKDDGKQYIDNFNTFIQLFTDIDESSMSFRYPYNQDLNKFFKWEKTLDIDTIKKEFDNIKAFLNSAIDVFYEAKGQYLEDKK